MQNNSNLHLNVKNIKNICVFGEERETNISRECRISFVFDFPVPQQKIQHGKMTVWKQSNAIVIVAPHPMRPMIHPMLIRFGII